MDLSGFSPDALRRVVSTSVIGLQCNKYPIYIHERFVRLNAKYEQMPHFDLAETVS
jgi:hypothetical protein